MEMYVTYRAACVYNTVPQAISQTHTKTAVLHLFTRKQRCCFAYTHFMFPFSLSLSLSLSPERLAKGGHADGNRLS